MRSSLRVERLLAEIHSEEILLIGDNETILQEMRQIIEENFSHEALIASSIAAAEELLRTVDFDLIIASADMKFVDGFKIMNFIASDEKFSTIPFALTTSDKLLELVEKINQPEAEEPADKKNPNEPSEIIKEPIEEETLQEPPAEEKTPNESPIAEESLDNAVFHSPKKKIANVVTNLIGYELDLHV